MSTPTKTIQTALLALQSVSSGNILKSSALDVSTVFEATFGIRFGRTIATALTVGCQIRIEGSFTASDDTNWIPLASFTSDTAAAADEVATGTNSSGQAVITCASTTGFAYGDFVFIKNTTFANSEFHWVLSIVSNTSVTMQSNLANAQNTGAATMYDSAQQWVVTVPCKSLKRLRVVCDNGGTGQAIAIEVIAITLDSIG